MGQISETWEHFLHEYQRKHDYWLKNNDLQ